MLSFHGVGCVCVLLPEDEGLQRKQHGRIRVILQKLARQSAVRLALLMAGAALAGIVVFPLLDETIYAENLPLFWAVIVTMALFIAGYVFQYGLYTTSRDGGIIAVNLAGLLVAAMALFLLAPYASYWAVTISMLTGSGVATVMKWWKWHVTQKELLAERS